MILWRGLVVGGMLAWGGVGVAQRLPGGVQPEHYALTITPDLKAATFTGVETIDLVLDKETNAITLNAAEIAFTRVLATPVQAQPRTQTSFGNDKPESQAAAVTIDGAKQQATFTFPQALPAGSVKLEIAYAGILNNKLRGFYLSKTKLRSYGVTQFEATDARRAFPSFDEPALKATFDVTLVVEDGDTAISNTKMVSDVRGPTAGKHTLRFATTPKMSTYLVAWVVGDFVCTKAKSDGVPIRACATPGKAPLTRFALDTAKWALHYYDNYFGIKYPLAKLDLVAIPDFEAGAMENFGCITFREPEMLVDEKYGTVPAKKEVATTVAHEMSHQWFGDMVTMAWWDNIWLNEGFATWMEIKASEKRHPEWKFDEDAAVDLDDTMAVDAQPTTRAIRTRAETPAEINEMFDDIAYGKAGAVIAMVENWVGEEVFRKGVREYLAAHLYGNATAEDFWDAQTRVSGLPVDKVMQGLIEQPGVPLVKAGETPGGASLAVAGRFLLPAPRRGERGKDGARDLPMDRRSPAGFYPWVVPVCVKATGGGTCHLVSGGQPPVSLSIDAAGPLFYANAGDKGYYRTEYAAGLIAPLTANAETELTPPERIGLLGDLWSLMRGGEGSAGQFLDLALAVKTDPNAMVLDSSLGRVETIGKLIATDAERKQLNAVVRREFGPVYAALGPAAKRESWDRVELRETLFGALGEAGDPAVMAEAETVSQELFAGHKPVDPSIVDAAVTLAAVKGDAAMYEKMLRVEKNTSDPDLKADGLRVLTRFQAPALVERTLEYAVSDEVRSQDGWMVISLLLARRPTQDQAWEFVEKHWTEIERKATIDSGARIVEAAGSFCSAERRDEVVRFFARHPVESSQRTLAKTVDSIDECIQLRAAQEPELRSWLEEHRER